jgi:hypothetical protein
MDEKGYRRAKDFFTWDEVTARIKKHLQSIV